MEEQGQGVSTPRSGRTPANTLPGGNIDSLVDGERATERESGAALRTDSIEDDDRDLAGRFLFVLGEARRALLLTVPDLVAFAAGRDSGSNRKRLGAKLNRCVRIGEEVVVPVRVGRRAGLRREDGVAVRADLLIGQGIDPFLAALRSLMMKEQEGRVLKGRANLPLVLAKLPDDAIVPVVRVGRSGRHGASWRDVTYLRA